MSPIHVIATIGPSSASAETIGAMIDAGMSLARLNFSWGTHAEHQDFTRRVRAEAAARGVVVPVLQDLSGPRVQQGPGHTFDPAVPVFTEKDEADLAAMLPLALEYVALSFVRNGADVAALRAHLNERGSQSKIIAKIERQEAIENIDDILAAADAIMIARGDLGEAVPYETLPFVTQNLIAAARRANVPSIVATEMLSSMLGDAEPSRADISDIADAVTDGASATMLSNETAVGTNPVAAVTVMRTVVEEAYRHVAEPPVAWR